MSNRTTQSSISRRGVLKGAAAAAGLSALGAFPAFGQTDKKIVLSTWGGDYANLLTKHVSTPVLGPRGWTVVNDEAQVVQRKAKTVAEKRLPKGTSDVQALTATDIAELTEIEGIVPARYVGRYKWITLERLNVLSAREVRELIQNSYDMVIQKTPAKKQSVKVRRSGDTSLHENAKERKKRKAPRK